MARASRAKPRRKRVGRVSYYLHHRAWYVYYREGRRQVRRRAGDTEEAAAALAAQINGQLAVAAPTPFSYTPLTVSELRRRFLDHHEFVLGSSLATIDRYRAATQHLENFAGRHAAGRPAQEIEAEPFLRYLRTIRVAPNGHQNAARRPLRGKGIRFIVEATRSLYGFAAKKRHVPPYWDNPFAGFATRRMRIEDAKPIHVFDEETELAFLRAASDWDFAVHFTLAKTGLRPGELSHLLLEDLDLDQGWIRVRNKPDLGWHIKTQSERQVPLNDAVVAVLRRAVGNRTAGPLFARVTFVHPQLPTESRRSSMARKIELMIAAQELDSGRALSRTERARLARDVWRGVGAIKVDFVRTSFKRITGKIGLPEATCPKSWRHSFATLLQEAGVDPLIRQLTLGHSPTSFGDGGLGMTAHYTHTRKATQKREVDRALSLWPRSLELAHAWAKGGS